MHPHVITRARKIFLREPSLRAFQFQKRYLSPQSETHVLRRRALPGAGIGRECKPRPAAVERPGATEAAADASAWAALGTADAGAGVTALGAGIAVVKCA